MPDCPLFSVYVLTYNSDPLKLEFTLESIRLQDYPNVEVVIADDGSSSKSHFRTIEKYENTSCNTHTIFNPANLGTVGNMKRALEKCSGELVIGLSPGDALYSKETLSKAMEFYGNSGAPFFIGFLRAYRITKEKHFEDVNFMAPNPENIHLLEKPARTFRKLLTGNFISGAGLVRSRKIVEEETLQLPDSIRFLEDWTFYTLATYHNHKIPVYDGYVYWYEYGEGISAGNDEKWNNSLSRDWRTFLEWLRDHGPDKGKNSLIKKRLDQLAFSSKHKSKILKGFHALFFYPDLLLHRIFARNELHSPGIKRFREQLTARQGDGFLEMLEETMGKQESPRTG